MKLKKRLSGFCSLLAGAFVLFAFASCADVAGSKETGSVSFTFGQDFVERIAAAARAAENSDDAGDSSSEIESKTVFEVQIAIRGDYSATKTISFEYNRPDSEKHNESVAEANYSTQNLTISSFELNSSDRGSYSNVPSQTLTFDNIPEGASVYAVGLVQVIDSYNYSGESFSSKYLAFIGVSENAKISAGQATSLPLLMKNAYFTDEIAYGKSSGYDADFVLSLSPNQDEKAGYWRVTYNYELISAGKYTVLEFGKSEKDGSLLPKRIAVTECIYVPESDVKKINDFYKAVTEGTGYSSHESSYSYQIALSARTSEINAGDGGHFSFTSLNGITVSFGIFPTYTLTISDNEGTIYTDSGDWMRDDDDEYLNNFNAAMKESLEKLGFQYVTTSYAYKDVGVIQGLTYTLYGNAIELENEAFFPTGYDSSKVKAWFSNIESEENSPESGSAGYQIKSFALYLFEDGTLLATKLKTKESSEGKTVEKVIERKGTYTLTTADNFEENSGTATFEIEGKTETYKFGMFNGAFLAYAAEDYSTEGYGIMCYSKRSDDVPEASEPTKDKTESSAGVVTPTLKKANIVLDEENSTDLYLNSGSLKFKMVDAETGEEVSSYKVGTWKLSYGGNEVDSEYYTYDYEGNFSLKADTPLLSAGTYQLHVELQSNGCEMSSANFDIVVAGGGYSMYYTFDASDPAFSDNYGSMANNLSANTLVKLTGEISDGYTTFFTSLKSSISNSEYLVAFDMSELTTTGTDKSIASCAFQSCSSVAEIIFPDDVTSIGYYAFASCSNLESISFGSNLESISGSGAFRYCSKLKTVTIPSEAPLTTIGSSEFGGCSSLESFTIPASLNYIGSGAFYQCDKLEEFILEEGGTGEWHCYFDSENQGLLSDMTEIAKDYDADSDYVFADNGISTLAQKLLICAKCSGDTSGNTGPIRKTITLKRE